MTSHLKDRRYRHDAFYKRAKRERYAARSVYKLEEIDERFRLFQAGQRVLDLGCRPGSWLQYVVGRIGPTGVAVGLDRQPLDVNLGPTAHVVVGDVLTVDPAVLRGELSGFDVVLSDMAPDTSGVAFSDCVRSVTLFQRAVELSLLVGCDGVTFVGKVLMGEGFEEALAQVKQAFGRAKVVRPAATRSISTEVYVVAQQRRRSG